MSKSFFVEPKNLYTLSINPISEGHSQNMIEVIEKSAYDELKSLHDRDAVIVDMRERDKLKAKLKIAVEALKDCRTAFSNKDFREKVTWLNDVIEKLTAHEAVCICGEINARNCPVHQQA